ncbi:MAG TPA: ABC transporter substrate-binding protein [Candidatus Binatia bacterium]|nr:ABC transporter substrate-binding protein [Candidatus Binatia bacterium]
MRSLTREKIVAAVAVVALLAALVDVSQAQQAPFDVNVVLPLTGPAAALGNSESEALKAAEQYLNKNGGIRGRRVHFAILDSQSSPQLDVQLTNQILAKHPAVVIDGGPATNCRGVSPLYARGPVLACVSPAFYPEKGSYQFASGVDSSDGMKTILAYIERRGWKRIAVLSLTDIAGQEADKALQSFLATPEFRDVTPVAWEHFSPGDISIATQLAKMRASSPQAVIIWATGSPVTTFYAAMRDAAWDIPVLGSNAVQSYALTARYGSVMPKNYYIYSLAWPGYQRIESSELKKALGTYFRAFEAAGVHPDGNTAMTWDSTLIVVSAFQKLGTDATAEQIRDYVLNLHDYAGASGMFDFRSGNQRGLDLADCIVVKWDHAKNLWEPVSGPAGAALR